MASYRTTVSLEPETYEAVRSTYRELGFARVGDLINVALRDYLHRRRIEGKLQALEAAADDPDYLRLVRRIGEELSFMDADGVAGEY